MIMLTLLKEIHLTSPNFVAVLIFWEVRTLGL
jgi:hypothetical protein